MQHQQIYDGVVFSGAVRNIFCKEDQDYFCCDTQCYALSRLSNTTCSFPHAQHNAWKGSMCSCGSRVSSVMRAVIFASTASSESFHGGALNSIRASCAGKHELHELHWARRDRTSYPQNQSRPSHRNASSLHMPTPGCGLEQSTARKKANGWKETRL